MPDPTAETAVADEPTDAVAALDVAAPDSAADVVTEDLLVEEVSIDGMCGVY